MKITAYMNLTTEEIACEPSERRVALAETVRRSRKTVYPSAELAEADLCTGQNAYPVSGEVPEGSLFELLGDIDQTEGRGGQYLAGIFDNYPAAFDAAIGLGVQGTPGVVRIRPGAENVCSTWEDWKRSFNRDEARKVSAYPQRLDLLTIVQLDSKDTSVLNAVDPEYAMWLLLNEKFGSPA